VRRVNELRFDDKVAVVTGGGRGIGRAYAHLLAARGASVVVNDLVAPGENPAADVVREIANSGGSAVANTDSVSTEAGASAVVATAVATYGQLDIVINNAGVCMVAPLAAASIDDIRAQIGVNVWGPYLVTRAAWPALVASGAGRVIQTTSTGMLGLAGMSAYATAKSAIIGLTRTAALEGAEHGIKVNAIAPAAATRMRMAGSSTLERLNTDPAEETEAFRGGAPALVAPAVAYLAHESCACSGEVLFASSGRVSRIYLAETVGIESKGLTVEDVAEGIAKIFDESGALSLTDSVSRIETWASALSM
jgi:NAD(P)-dependent dehydrogenase (short-subunit alcohol dehydrogenase family)